MWKISLIIMFLIVPCLLLTGDQRISKIVEMFSIEHLKAHVRNLHYDRSPYDRSGNLEKAADYIYHELKPVGLPIRKEPFLWEGRRFINIVAEKRGLRHPDEILILGAHYDTVPGSPGADDNAGGVAVLLEVARNLRHVRLGSTVRAIAFSLEEYGFGGSTHHAQKARERGEKILGMISLEMVGFTHPKQNYPPDLHPEDFPPHGDFIGIVGNERSKLLVERVYGAFRKHVPELPAQFLLVPDHGERMPEARLSDHSPFWDRNYPALMVTDTAFLRNPNYHLPSDTMETLDFEFMRRVAAGIFQSTLELANTEGGG
jgi:hypothetical protein